MYRGDGEISEETSDEVERPLTTTAYHPQGDGQTEWVNQELE